MAARRPRGVAEPAATVLYWDTSAIVSALFRDAHSEKASKLAREPGLHMLSSLAWAETQAIIVKAERERAVTGLLGDAARESLEQGPWRRTNVVPDWTFALQFSRKWPLRGADLWHLAAARTLQVELPELRVISFDERLRTAAAGEGLAASA